MPCVPVQAIVLVYDPTDRDTFDNISYWMQQIDKVRGLAKPATAPPHPEAACVLHDARLRRFDAHHGTRARCVCTCNGAGTRRLRDTACVLAKGTPSPEQRVL